MLQPCVPGSQLWLEIGDKHGNKSEADCLRAPTMGRRQCGVYSCGSEVRYLLGSLGLIRP